jgi:transposase-like protein
MTLASFKLRDVLLTFACPHCGRALLKKGSWFASTNRFRCLGCHREARIAYSDKVRLFAKHANLARRATERPAKNTDENAKS